MKGQGGFTLLEILVVLSLLGILAGLVGTALVSANRATAKAERFSTRLDEVQAAQHYLRRAISQALPLATGSPVAKPPRFIGAPEQLTFHGPLPDSIGGGLYQQQLTLSGHRLLVTFARLDGQAAQRFGEPQVLLRDVRALALSYRGRSPLGQDSGWVANWPWPERLPKAVRIQATLAGGVPWVTEQVNLRLDLASEPNP
ncbi:general secretion pathway protein J [Pseudomonas sp. M47T1]|uniref:prepilin-type N-terminal cleavage/methylation domain-containing protein n=1 Tax=Pseudomonas sp. M47T1 TaxID=1179778 RepID=UPI00026078FE|nr:prepilin-type N-terminal cleavage/methylation domain-containing protein [Pseudomonas sp. M47T1]EIK94457.1 general secretion pathway protein J [Pseudomonas sp. M47T1]